MPSGTKISRPLSTISESIFMIDHRRLHENIKGIGERDHQSLTICNFGTLLQKKTRVSIQYIAVYEDKIYILGLFRFPNTISALNLTSPQPSPLDVRCQRYRFSSLSKSHPLDAQGKTPESAHTPHKNIMIT